MRTHSWWWNWYYTSPLAALETAILNFTHDASDCQIIISFYVFNCGNINYSPRSSCVCGSPASNNSSFWSPLANKSSCLVNRCIGTQSGPIKLLQTASHHRNTTSDRITTPLGIEYVSVGFRSGPGQRFQPPKSRFTRSRSRVGGPVAPGDTNLINQRNWAQIVT